MADVKAAVDFLLTEEDGTLSGTITNIPGDKGGVTRFGLTAKWHPELVASGFFTTMPGWCALSVAEEVYQKTYDSALCLRAIDSDAIAKALLSFAANDGRFLGVKLLQQAVGVETDGQMGPQTVDAVNAADEKELLDTYCGLQAMHYEALGKEPDQAKFLNGWLNRVHQVENLA